MSRPSTAATRDLRLDFFRGLALVVIFIDHIPGNLLSQVTLQNVGFSDAAEIFVFLSGYSAALAFGPWVREHGYLVAGLQVLRRVWTLYVAHIFVFMLFTAQVAWTIQRFGNPLFAEEMNVASFLGEPDVTILKTLLLQFQPTHLGILPMYILLLAGFLPLSMMFCNLGVGGALAVSALVWGWVQVSGLNLPTHPAGVWYFNPFAWQFLFNIGAAMAWMRGTRPVGGALPKRRWLLRLALVVLLIGLCGQIGIDWAERHDRIPSWAAEPLWRLLDKTALAPLRVVHFLALVYAAAYMLRNDTPLRRRWARPILVCGQQSLPIFCLTIFLAMAGQTVLSELNGSPLAHLAVNLTGLTLLFGTAYFLDWIKRASTRARARRAGAPDPTGGASL